jgi:hypothetical protein
VPTKNIDCADDPIKDQEKEDIKCGDEWRMTKGGS